MLLVDTSLNSLRKTFGYDYFSVPSVDFQKEYDSKISLKLICVVSEKRKMESKCFSLSLLTKGKISMFSLQSREKKK